MHLISIITIIRILKNTQVVVLKYANFDQVPRLQFVALTRLTDQESKEGGDTVKGNKLEG